jgi:hypothetical protein
MQALTFFLPERRKRSWVGGGGDTTFLTVVGEHLTALNVPK